jgi:hypothetical protein
MTLDALNLASEIAAKFRGAEGQSRDEETKQAAQRGSCLNHHMLERIENPESGEAHQSVPLIRF